jgi:DNA (cytosine-5)-methyltransferase 1
LGDALEADLSGFDAVWASPPCQGYTRKPSVWGRKRNHFLEHPDLLVATREKLIASGLPYIIENVPGAKIKAQILLCGTMFGLRIIKHRYFESNCSLPLAPMQCDHRNVFNPWCGKGRSAKEFREAQGTPWIPTGGGASRKEGITGDLYNAIPPAYSEFLGKQIISILDRRTNLLTAPEKSA